MINEKQPSKAFNISLWIGQVILSVMFLMAGVMKTFQPMGQLAEMIPWTQDMSMLMVRLIGISELLGGLGLLLPALLKMKPALTQLAAAALGLVMVMASLFHIFRGEYASIGINVFMLAIALYVAWGRHFMVPIQPRS